MTRGVLRSAIPAESTPNVILRASGGPSIVGGTLENERLLPSAEEAIRLDAAAIGISVFVGSEYETQTLNNLAMAVNEYERYGIPVMAVTAVGKELEKRDARYLALASRIAAELGARVVKTYYTEDFDTDHQHLPGSGRHCRRPEDRRCSRSTHLRPRRDRQGRGRRQPRQEHLAALRPGRHGQGLSAPSSTTTPLRRTRSIWSRRRRRKAETMEFLVRIEQDIPPDIDPELPGLGEGR